ncbi:uncharacterized protein BDZ99DRAFT_15735 [Mytilinidion resinicola]|uniref:Clr5 domain-containing protein n=1 Tax=Mytilinidion resinicola TaxID=574789 RepID=A0A6A6ZAU9_9PEZI|nr:uncharacterized protein BDZ99DRAFT_15735 [Mytilinidion resinicola]KAF2817425.1 hypothetical protein BDZ99DRAFT_15735 [Mytilinidion resinicola]
MNPPPKPQSSSGRSAVITKKSRTKYEPYIRKLWIDGGNSLQDTMAKMAAEHHFVASEDQYKKQFRRWKWSKNTCIPNKEGLWMLHKAEQGKVEHDKDTMFEFRGQILTEGNTRPRLERKKVEMQTQSLSLGS